MAKLNILLAAGVSAVLAASGAHATTDFLVEGTGWHYGESHAQNSASMYNFDGSGGVFTLQTVITTTEDLSFVDGYVPGDKYSLKIAISSGSATYNTQFLDGTNFDPISNLYAGPYGSTFGPDWLSATYGHAQVQLSPGTYTITVKDLCSSSACGGYPAGWGIRLDAVPEASTWALMLLGVGGLGGALRSRRKAAIA